MSPSNPAQDVGHKNRLMKYKNDFFLNWIESYRKKKTPRIMILGFFDEDCLQKLRKKDSYLTIVDQKHYFESESVTARHTYYDIVIAREIIAHVHDQNKFMEFCYNLLRKDGLLLLETSNVHTWHSKLLFLFSDYLSFFRGKYIENYEHKHPLFTWSLEQLTKGKFRLERKEFNFGVIPLLRIRFNTKRKLFGDSFNIVLRKI